MIKEREFEKKKHTNKWHLNHLEQNVTHTKHVKLVHSDNKVEPIIIVAISNANKIMMNAIIHNH